MLPIDLINDHIDLACNIAANTIRRLNFPPWLDQDEAEQIALTTLCHCAAKFKQGNFGGYARRAILNALTDAIRSQIKLDQIYIEDNPELREKIW